MCISHTNYLQCFHVILKMEFIKLKETCFLFDLCHIFAQVFNLKLQLVLLLLLLLL